MPPPPDDRFTARLIFLHGFTQTHHHWHPVASAILESGNGTRSAALVDLPGHGLSDGDRSAIDATATCLPDIAGAGTYIGYSMGGRIALLAAVSGHPAIERLVLVGATAGIDDDDERSRRARADGELADRVERDGVAAFVDQWLTAPMFAGLPTDQDARAHRLRNSAPGLGHSLRSCGTGNQPSLWHRLDQITIPVLVIAGELDHKFTEIGCRLLEHLEHGTLVSIDGAGHAAHTERPDLVTAAIMEWFGTTAGSGQPSASPIANSRP
ncbi:MAG: alpha/beta fold hydrolase [Ilumatobacteraceae bacterium]